MTKEAILSGWSSPLIQKSKLNVPGSEIRIRDNNPDMVNLNQYRYFGAHQPRLNIVGNVTGITEL